MTDTQDDNSDTGSGTQTSEERFIWDINPTKVRVELNDGKIRMREQAVYTGQIRVHKAVQHVPTSSNDCVNLYIQAESRDGADVELNLEQAKQLRDALDNCIHQTVEKIEESDLEIDVSAE